ncbi:MAG: ATP-binding protein [Polyangiales bacterium]
MKAPSKPENESERLTALRATELLDTHAEEAFDELVSAVSKLLDVPIAIVSLVDEERQWFKARVGLESEQTARDVSFCGHAILESGPMVIPDACDDARFKDNPLVLGPPHMRFYAGVPLLMPTGEAVGTLCVADQRPRTLSEAQIEALESLAKQVMSLVELRLLNSFVRRSNERLKQKAATLKRARALIESSPDTMIVVDRKGLCQDLSATIVLPWERETPEHDSVVGKSVAQVFDGLELGLEAHVKAAIDHGQSAEFERVVDRNGARLHLLVLVSRCGDGEALVVVRDVTKERELARLKDEFVSMIAHEIRTPLSSIRASLRLLDGGVSGELNADQAELVSISSSSAARLSRLVNDVLDLERLSRGPVELRRQAVPIDQLARDAARELDALAKSSQVRLEVQSLEGFEVDGDRDRLMQVVVNLLGNAVRFTRAGGVVVLRVDSESPGRVRLSVRDQGPGIAKEQQARLFQRFERLDRRGAGTGLGLAIVRAIVEQHGGLVGVESELGQGATFFVELAGRTPSQRALAQRWAREAVEEARRSFVASLEAVSVELAALERDGAQAEHREPLRRLAHRIAGTAGSCELHALSALARRVEDECVGGAGAEAMRTHIQALRQAVDELVSS